MKIFFNYRTWDKKRYVAGDLDTVESNAVDKEIGSETHKKCLDASTAHDRKKKLKELNELYSYFVSVSRDYLSVPHPFLKAISSEKKLKGE